MPRLARRRDCRLEPLDDELLAELTGSGIRPALFVDQASPASEEARHAGWPVWVSPRRAPPGSEYGADHARAREIFRQHRQDPFDLVLMSADAGVPPRFFVPELGLPLAVTLGGGPLADLEQTWDDPQRFVADWATLYAAMAPVIEADVLVSDVLPRAFGLRCATPLWRATRPESPAGRVAPAAAPPLLVLVATTPSARNLDGMVDRLIAERGPVAPTTNLVIVTRATSSAGRPSGVRVVAGCPAELRRQVVSVPQGEDGVAADLLEVADELVLASPRELAIPQVAAVARRIGARVLGDSASEEVEAAWLVDALGGSVPRASRGRLEVMQWDDGEIVAQTLSCLRTQREDHDALLLHAHDADAAFFALLGGPAPKADVVVWGRPDPIFGQGEMRWVAPAAVILRQPLWSAASRVAATATDVSALVRWAVQAGGVDRVSLLCLTAPPEAPLAALVGEALHEQVPLPLATPLLPTPRFVPIPSAPPAPIAAPPQAVRVAVRQVPSVADWARKATWNDRVRLALPWRFGLLMRGMKGRW